MPQFIVRQSLIIGFTAGAFVLGFHLNATVAMLASVAAVWIAMIGQKIVLNRRLGTIVASGPKVHDFAAGSRSRCPFCWSRAFISCCPTPMCSCCSSFARRRRSAFTSPSSKPWRWCLSFTTPRRRQRRTASLSINAAGDRERLEAYLAHAIKWTFWPSLAATLLLLALGKPMLWLFGPQFVTGYGIMFVAAIGLVVRSAIGPVERLLNTLGHQHACASAYALAFGMNVALWFALVPRYGGHGAAAAYFDLARVRNDTGVLDRPPQARIACAGSAEKIAYAAVQPPSIDRLLPVI